METPMPEGGAETILVVEDEEVLRELVKDILESDGYRVLAAASGREALKVWREHGKSVDLLLTDVTMPDGMSGRDLAAMVLEENPRLPVIFSSGFSHQSLEPHELTEGQTFFPKPYEPADLSRAVRAALDYAACREASIASSNI
jgi:CheY-like chemotaxis protein